MQFCFQPNPQTKGTTKRYRIWVWRRRKGI